MDNATETTRLRPLLVGEAPSRKSDPSRPFSGRSGDRLRALLGRELDEVFEVVNVFDSWPGGGGGKGSRWNANEARLRTIFGWDFQGRRVVVSDRDVVCAGRRVADALGGPSFAKTEYLAWVDYPGWRGRAAIIPHPSGLVRFWNDPADVARAAAFLRSLV